MKTRIGKKKAKELVQESKGRFMTIEFKDKKGVNRKMNCIYAGPSKNDGLGYILVKEINQGFKNVNTQTWTSLKLNKKEYKIS